MHLRFAKLLLVLCILAFIGAALFLGLRHLSFFNIKDVEVNVSGSVDSLNANINRCIVPYKGLNIFTADVAYLKKTLSDFEGVETVKVKRYYPSKLIVDIYFIPYSVRVYTIQDNKKACYMASLKGLDPVSDETYSLFSRLPELLIEPKYADFVLRWGPDNGYAQMCNLCAGLENKSLKIGLKYYNNSSEDFGVLEVNLDDYNSVLYVKEAVTTDRLSEAIDIIASNSKSGSSNEITSYNLYASALIKKNGT